MNTHLEVEVEARKIGLILELSNYKNDILYLRNYLAKIIRINIYFIVKFLYAD